MCCLRNPLLIALLLAVLAGCSQTSAQRRNEQADPQEVWLGSHAHHIALEDDDFDDLDFLKPLLEGKRVVQLGENAHGIREYNLAKARIVKFLHQELGFGVLAFESALYQCYDADLDAAAATALSTLTGCAYGVWHTEEVLPLFEYMRATRQSDRPLRLAGIDVQPIGRNKAGRPRFLSRVVAHVDAAYGADVLALDSTFLSVYALGGRERRSYFRSEDGQRMEEAYDRLAVFIAANEAVILAGANDVNAVGVARRTARSMASYIRQQSAPGTQEYVEHRDEGMAENLTFLLGELFADQKVMVWGHNFHLRHDNISIPPDSSMFPDVAARTMGSWIRERFGDQVYTVGMYAYEGQAADNSGKIFEIEPAEPGSLESLLFGISSGALFVDLSKAKKGPETAWMDEPISARYNGTIPLSIVPRNQYDAILHIGTVTPRAMLY